MDASWAHRTGGDLATSFDAVAELYERARPTYPRELFDDLADGVAPDPRVLEIGAGTGQATRGLLERGWRVLALEPGPGLARVARRVLQRAGDVEIVEAPFEQWAGGEPGSFDLVVAATSWHWLDPAVAFGKAAALLRPGGRLAIVSTEHVQPDLGADPFFREVERAYDAVGMGAGRGGPAAPDAVADPEVAAMTDSGYFEPPSVRRYLWSRDYTAEGYLDLLSTYSGHIAAAPSARQKLFSDIRSLIHERPTASVRKHYLTILQASRRQD